MHYHATKELAARAEEAFRRLVGNEFRKYPNKEDDTNLVLRFFAAARRSLPNRSFIRDLYPAEAKTS